MTNRTPSHSDAFETDVDAAPRELGVGLATGGARRMMGVDDVETSRETTGGGHVTEDEGAFGATGDERTRRETTSRGRGPGRDSGTLTMVAHLSIASVSRVSPQVVLAGVVGAGAQWLKISRCDASERYSTTCRYAFGIEAHVIVSAVLSFLLVFRAVQAFSRYEDGKEALMEMKEALRNVAAVAECESKLTRRKSASHTEIRRLCNLAYAFMRQSLRESRIGVRDPRARGVKFDVSTRAMLPDDRDGTPSVAELTSDEEREKYAKLSAENRPEAAVIDILCRLERSGVLHERAAIEGFREAQRALNAYRRASMIVDTPTPTQYTHLITVTLFCFIFSLPFALSTVTDWRTPLVCAMVAWLFYGVNEIACALENPFKWTLPAHPLNVFGRRIQREMDAFRVREDATGIDEDDGLLAVDSLNYSRWRSRLWFVTDCFAWSGTTLPLIVKQIIFAATVGIIAQWMKVDICGDNVTDSSQCMVTFDLSAHSILAIPISFLLVTNTDWGYERFVSSKTLIVDLQNELRSLLMCACIFTAPRNESDGVHSIKPDILEIERMTGVLFSLTRIVVRELVSKTPSGDVATLNDCLSTDEYAGAASLKTLLTDDEITEVKSLPANALVSWAAMKLNARFDAMRQNEEISDRFSAEAYRRVCSSLKHVQGLIRVTTTPVPNHFHHLLRMSLFFYAFSAPFIFSVTYQWITSLPAMLIALGFYGVVETSKGMMEPFSWSGPRHDLGHIGTCMLSRHERLRALALHARSEIDDWNKLEDEAASLNRQLTPSSKVKKPIRTLILERFKHAISERSLRSRLLPNEFDREAASVKNILAMRIGWLTNVFILQGTVIPGLSVQIILAGAIALAANGLKIRECGNTVSNVTQCAFTFDSSAHVMSGAIIGFTLIFRLALSYTRYYDGKGALGLMVNSIRCLNVGVSTMLRSSRINATPSVLKEVDEDAAEIRRLSNVLMGFMRQAIRERRHGVDPSSLTKKAPTTDEYIEDMSGWPSLSLLLSDKEKDVYAKADYRARIGICASKIISIIDERRRLKHISDRSAYEMLGHVENCISACATAERLLASSMPFAFLHLMNFVLFVFVMTAPFVFVTSYKWLAPLPSMLVAASLFGIAEVGSLLDDPFGWSEPKHDLTLAGWASYTETLSIHEKAVRTFGGREDTTHSGVDALILSGAAVPNALKQPTVLQQVRRKHGANSGASYFRQLLKFRNTIFPHVWPIMSVMLFFGIGAQAYKLSTCGSGVAEHNDCDTTFHPAAVSIVGRMCMFVLVYRFFFAFRVFQEAKTGVYDLMCAVQTLNVQVCSHLRESSSSKSSCDKPSEVVRNARYSVLRLSNALFAVMRQSLWGVSEHGCAQQKDAEILFLDAQANSHLGSLLDEDGTTAYLSLLNMSADERVAEIATRLLKQIEFARKPGCLSNRGAAMMVNATQDALHAFSRCTRAKTTKTPYSLNHLINLTVLLWMFSTASVLVVSFKYLTWLPLVILSLTLYGLPAISMHLEEPFMYNGMCSNDLADMGQHLWNTCASTHEILSESDEMKHRVEALVKAVETKSAQVANECYNRAQGQLHESVLMKPTENANPTWTFPEKRVFRGGKFGLLRELFSIHGTLIVPTLPYIFVSSGVAIAMFLISKAVCTYDEIYDSGTCKTLVGFEAHSLAAPVLSFCIAYLLNLTHRRYYSGRKYLDDIVDHARDIIIDLNIAFHVPETAEDRQSHERMLHMLNALVAFIRQSVRECSQGYPSQIKAETADMLNTVLDDDFTGSPSTKDLLSAETRNMFARIAPAFRVARCAADLKRELRSLPKHQRGNEQRYYRLYRSIDGITDAWTNCEIVVGTPIPPFYMFTVYFLCSVFVLTSPLAFIHTYGTYVAVPVALLTFVITGVVIVSRRIMNPFTWTMDSHDINALMTSRVWRLTELFSPTRACAGA